MIRVARPRGMTAFCLLLGWLSFAGYANALLISLGKMLPFPNWFGFLALAYGITASVAAYKLWRMDGSGIAWFRRWAIVVVVMTAASIPIFHGLGLVSFGHLLGLAVLTVIVLWPMDRYISRKLSPDTID